MNQLTKVFLVFIVVFGLFSCEKDELNSPKLSDQSTLIAKEKKNQNKSYPIVITVDEDDPDFVDDVIEQIGNGEIVQVTFNDSDEPVYHVIENPNPNNGPNNPPNPEAQITCALSDENCRLAVRIRWQYNVNNGICFDMGKDIYNDMLWICDEPCKD